MVHTTSPLFTGSILLICVPTFPDGCGPETLCKVMPDKPAIGEVESLPTQTCTLPLVNLPKAVTAACNASSFPCKVKS